MTLLLERREAAGLKYALEALQKIRSIQTFRPRVCIQTAASRLEHSPDLTKLSETPDSYRRQQSSLAPISLEDLSAWHSSAYVL